MTRLKKEIVRTSVIAALLLAAYIPNLLWWMYGIRPPGYFIHQSNAIYIALLSAWGVSIRHRIIQKQARRYLIGIAALMVFWIAVRTIKYYFVSDINTSRLLWYFYYIPMLLIPTLGVFISLSLGRPENYRLPKWTCILLVPAALLIFAVLTNDFHQLVFSFPGGGSRADSDYSYELLYCIVTAWEMLTAFMTLSILIAKSRVPRSRNILWLPFIPLAACIVYAVLYITGWLVLRLVARDMTITFCLLFTAILESCIRCGLIQSNSKYAELFMASTIGVRITDSSGNILISSEGAGPAEPCMLLQAQSAPVLLPGGIRLSSAPIRGGHAVWQEDVSELLSVISELETADEELRGKNAILAEEYKTRRTRQALAEKNRLYNKVQSQTESQIEWLADLTLRLVRADTPEETRALISHIAVLTAYIKRRNNLIFIAEENGMIPAVELEYCMKETAVNLELAGIRCCLKIGLDAPLPAGQLAFLYSRFESVVEVSLDSLQTLYVSVIMEDGEPVMNMIVLCGEDLSALADEWLSVEAEGENEWVLTCSVP